MKKRFLGFIGILIFITALSGCEGLDSNNLKNNIITAEIPQEYYEIFANQQKLYDDGYKNATPYYTPEQAVKGAVISAKLDQKEELAGFFKRLENQNYNNIVVLSDTDLSLGNSSVYTTLKSFKTPYGYITTDQDLITKMQNQKIAVADEKIFEKENARNYLAPFIKKTFPQSRYIPILINAKISQEDKDKLASWFVQNLGPQTLIIAETTAKTSQDSKVADFQLQFTKNVLENFDTTKFPELPFDSTASISILNTYLTQSKSQKGQSQFTSGESGSFIEYFMDGPISADRNIYLVSFGDIMLDRVVRNLIDTNGLDYPFQKMDEKYLKQNDILMANLEGPIAKKAIPTTKTIAFRFMPDVAPILKKYYFDALSQANNHTFDMGITGYNDSRQFIRDQGIMVFGNPEAVNDESIATTEIQNKKLAFIGLDDVDFKIDQKAAVQKIQDLTNQGYKVIPFIHWGIEYTHSPNERQQTLAHAFLDAGAVAVIACHPHVVQTFEIYNGKPIFYSLGNAIFDQYFSPDTQEGLSTALIISDDQIQAYFIPIKIIKSQMQLMNENERKVFMEKFVTWGNYSAQEKQDILNGKIDLALH